MAGRYVVSWSGGKDSALALFRTQDAGLQVVGLMTMLSPRGWSMSHRIPRALLEEQAQALGLPLTVGIADWDGYEDEFRRVLLAERSGGVHGIVFGDIDVDDHRAWCRRICAEAGLEALHPLWGTDQSALMDQLLATGFDARIVVVELAKLGLEWLGKRLDHTTVAALRALCSSIAGEGGEYHTLVVDGPGFRQSLSLKEAVAAASVLVEGRYGFLDLVSQPLADRG